MNVDIAKARAIHDVLLADMQDRDSHTCALCADSNAEMAADAAQESRKGEISMDPIYTQEQVDSLVAAARADEQAKLTESQSETLAELQSELTKVRDEITDLQSKRDEDQMELTAARDKVTELEGEIARRDEEVARLARREDRVAKVAEVANFSEKYVSENVDRWIDMSENDFASYLEAVRELRSNITVDPAAETTEDTVVPEETAMTNEHVETVEVPARRKLFDALKGGNL